MLVVLTALLTLCILTCDARLVQDIKMFDVVKSISNTVNETDGFLPNSVAYQFTDNTGDLIVPTNISTMFARQAFSVNQFTVKAYLLRAVNSDGGTIIFLSRDKDKGGAAFNIVFKSTANGFNIGSRFYVKNDAQLLECEFRGLDIDTTKWLHLEVRVHIPERLIRCIVTTNKNKTFYRHTQQQSRDDAFDRFPLGTNLRLAQQFSSQDEGLLKITERFVGKLQDVVISFGDPNCTIYIEDNAIPPTPTPKVCPTANVTCLDDKGNKRDDGEEWEEEKWTKCKCSKRHTRCTKSVKRCIQGGKEYRDGDVWYNRLDDSDCEQCECVDGTVRCTSSDRKWKNSGCDLKCGENNCNSLKPGCYCPGRLNKGKCTETTNCPCTYNNREYAATFHQIGCNLCECASGIMDCYDNVYC